jgi:Polyketide cyclase / dehydrase and lipid transport
MLPNRYARPATHASAFMTLALCATLAGLFAGASQAHGPTRQRVIEKVSINAPPSVVWVKLKNFDALKDWHSAVAESPADKGNTVGSVRQIKLKGGGTLTDDEAALKTITGVYKSGLANLTKLVDGS